MPVKKEIPYNSGIFFITFTCSNWIPIFEQLNCYDIVYNWFDYLKTKGHFINAYVIMPNHVHVVIAFRKSDKKINKIVGDGKRFMSYEIINRLKSKNESEVLTLLKNKTTKSDEQKNKQFAVFEPSFAWKHLNSIEFILQKLDYIHKNPIKYNYSLDDESQAYIHSSAPSYGYAGKIIYEVSLIHDILQVEL
ncbi:MAG: hypothetical protein FGM54_02380 [Chitinophagaceae bacterium]|nr:hypothetical protein [Chitinophagaceae bacterium]